MPTGELFFKILKDVLLSTEELKRLKTQIENLAHKLECIDKHPVRNETIARIVQGHAGKRLLNN